MADGNNFSQYLANPRSFTMRKWLYDLLGLDYASHDAIVERVAASLTTQRDLEDFGKLIGQVFEKGYRKAVEDYGKEAAKLGLKVMVVPPQSS